MYIYTYTLIYVYIYTHIYIYMYIYICTYVYIYVHMYIYICIERGALWPGLVVGLPGTRLWFQAYLGQVPDADADVGDGIRAHAAWQGSGVRV